MYRISKAVSLFIVSLMLFGVLSALSSCKKPEERQSVKLTLSYDDENSIITGKAVYKFVNATNEAVKAVPVQPLGERLQREKPSLTQDLRQRLFKRGLVRRNKN